ncbi:MAG TPA: ATP-binding protein [Actinomycetota bacterium]|jgi:PAS domain S-box-containing protein
MPLFGRSRAELPRTSDKRDAALEAALKVSEIASSAMALPQAVRAMVQTAMKLLNADQGSIMLLDEAERELRLVAAGGISSQVPIGSSLPVGESVAGHVLATGKPLRLDDVDTDAFVNFVPKERPPACSIVVPLRAQGRPIGVLNLAVSAPSGSFNDDDLRLAQMFADQAAGVIYRARLHEEAEQRSSDLLALVESSRGLLGTLDVDKLLQDVLDGGGRLAGSRDGFACLFDHENGTLRRGVFRGVDKPTIRALIEHESVAEAIESADLATFAGGDDTTWVALGLHTSMGSRGVLVIAADEAIVAERTDILRAFAQQCASAMGAAELYGEVVRKETELASIIHGVVNPIVLVDAAAKIVALNPAAEQLFGVSLDFSSGRQVEGALGHPDLERLLAGHGELQDEVEVGTPQRTYKVRVNDVQVPGSPMGRVLIMDDITVERERIQTQRDFVAMIGHELRTPLTIIKGFAKTLMRRVPNASVEEAKDALSTIDAKAAQLERLIEDLLYVSKIEAREASLRIETNDVAALVREVATDVLEQHPDREISLELPADLTWPCDETKVSLVLRHLVENALKYSETPEAVTIRASDEGDSLRIDVVDKGAGIVSTDIPHIFERFRQVDGSSTRAHGGTGVGLYLCAQLVRVHGGRIWVDSTWGKGSTFSFSLSRRAAANEVVKMYGKKAAQSA